MLNAFDGDQRMISGRTNELTDWFWVKIAQRFNAGKTVLG
jgi:hypothetical protein